MSPVRATLLHSPGRKPWVICYRIFIEPGGTTERINSDARAESAAPSELNLLLSKVYPGFHIGLRPHSTLGYAKVSCLKALVISLNTDNNTASTAQCNGIYLPMQKCWKI